MLNEVDYKITKIIYDLVNSNSFTKNIPNYFGLIPYEFYVIPGMYVAILQVIWLGTPNPLQFHLLPHWFSYSIFQFLKKSIDRERPGCFHKNLGEHINSSHCSHGHELQSFPSGHTGVASSLATALTMEMFYSENPKFFEIKITKEHTKRIISGCGIFVAIMISLQRISKGYHSFFDVMSGMLIGVSIGFISWITLNYYKKSYFKSCDDKENKENKENKNNIDSCDNYNKTIMDKEFSYWMNNWNLFKSKLYDDDIINRLTGFSRIILTIPVLYLLIKFLTKDVYNLASIKH